MTIILSASETEQLNVINPRVVKFDHTDERWTAPSNDNYLVCKRNGTAYCRFSERIDVESL